MVLIWRGWGLAIAIAGPIAMVALMFNLVPTPVPGKAAEGFAGWMGKHFIEVLLAGTGVIWGIAGLVLNRGRPFHYRDGVFFLPIELLGAVALVAGIFVYFKGTL